MEDNEEIQALKEKGELFNVDGCCKCVYRYIETEWWMDNTV